jgi:negative regulator of flagellin synthesis FlgM
MRIPGDIPKITGIYDKHKSLNRTDISNAVVSKKDVVSISTQAKDFQTIFRALKEIPDIRQGKVNELLERYESGNYDIDGNDVAEKVINNVFDKKA